MRHGGGATEPACPTEHLRRQHFHGFSAPDSLLRERVGELPSRLLTGCRGQKLERAGKPLPIRLKVVIQVAAPSLVVVLHRWPITGSPPNRSNRQSFESQPFAVCGERASP